MSDSSAVENFKVMVFRSLDAAARDFTALSTKVDEVRLALAAAGGKLEAAAADSERIRDLQAKVTRLEVRAGIIGALTGAAASILIPLAVRYFTH